LLNASANLIQILFYTSKFHKKVSF